MNLIPKIERKYIGNAFTSGEFESFFKEKRMKLTPGLPNRTAL